MHLSNKTFYTRVCAHGLTPGLIANESNLSVLMIRGAIAERTCQQTKHMEREGNETVPNGNRKVNVRRNYEKIRMMSDTVREKMKCIGTWTGIHRREGTLESGRKGVASCEWVVAAQMGGIRG